MRCQSTYSTKHTRTGLLTLDSFMCTLKMEHLIPAWTPWTDKCCDLLQRHAEVDGDVMLTYLVRLANMMDTANKSIRENEPQVNQQVQLMLLGLETQHREMKEAMVPHLSRSGKFPCLSTMPSFL